MALADIVLRVGDADLISMAGLAGVRLLERDLVEGETTWVLAGVYHDENLAPVVLAFLVDEAAGERVVDALVTALVDRAAVVDVRPCTRLPTLAEAQALEALANGQPQPEPQSDTTPFQEPGPVADNPEEIPS